MLTCRYWGPAESRSSQENLIVQCTVLSGYWLLSGRRDRSEEITYFLKKKIKLTPHFHPSAPSHGQMLAYQQSASQLGLPSEYYHEILSSKTHVQLYTWESHQAMVSLTLKLCPGCSTSSSSRRPNRGLLWPATRNTQRLHIYLIYHNFTVKMKVFICKRCQPVNSSQPPW